MAPEEKAFRAGFEYGSDHDGIDHRLREDDAWKAYQQQSESPEREAK